MKELLSVGYAVIDKIKDQEYFGGAAAGIAINGNKLGLDTGLVAIFGDDEKSKGYLSYLESLGIDLTQSQRLSNASIPTNIISQSDRTAGWINDGITQFLPSVPIRSSALNAYQVVHLASPHFSVAQNVAHTKELGVLTYSPGPKLRLNPQYLNINVLRRTKVLFLNDEEWQTTKLIEVLIPSKSVNISETTGAGDAFALGFIIGYINRIPFTDCGIIGTILASHILEQKGVIINDSALERFSQFMKREYGINLSK